MSWGFKITNTAKISVEVRWILLHRTDSTLRELEALRKRAIKNASDESIASFAAGIGLPSLSPLGEDELRDTSSSSNLLQECWREQTAIANLSSDLYLQEYELEPVQGADFQYLEDESQNTASFESSERDVLVDTKEKKHIDDVEFSFQSVLETPTQPPSPVHKRESDSQAQSRESCYGTGLYGTDKQHPLMTPRCQTFPTQLRRYLDHFDSQDLNVSPLDVSNIETTSQSLQVATPIAYLPNMDCSCAPVFQYCPKLVGRQFPVFPVTADHLLKLQTHIRHVIRFREYLSTSLYDVAEALNRREDRYRMRETHGDITTFMRSRGDGSPLAQAITAEEKWPDEDELWGLPEVRAPRRKIYRGSKSSETMTETDWASSNESNPLIQTRKVVW